MSILKGIDKEYNTKQDKMKKLLNSNKLNIKFFEDNILQIFDNNKLVIEAEYNFWGIIRDNEIMVWANSIPLIYEKFKKNALKLRNTKEFYKEYIKTNNNDMYFYSSILENDMNLLPDKKYIEHIKKMLLYLSKDKFIIAPINSINNIQLITIKKIRKKYI